MENNNPNVIEVYKDTELLDLIGRWAKLESEEVEFLLSEISKNAAGRTQEDIMKDKVVVLEQTIGHLKSNYPRNDRANSWIAVNEFTRDRIKEDLKINN